MANTQLSIRAANRHRVLKKIRDHGVTPRVELSRQIGLSGGAITAITSELIEEGVLKEESPSAVSSPGRPTVGISFNRKCGLVAGASLRMNQLSVIISDYSGQQFARRVFATRTRSLDEKSLLDFLEQSLNEALEHIQGSLVGIGLALQGSLDSMQGRQIWCPVLSCRDAEISGPLSERMGAPVKLENDTVAFGSALMADDENLRRGLVSFLIAGHGIGMSVFNDGSPLTRETGFVSEIGHVKRKTGGSPCRCGQRGCYEAYIAAYALYRDAGFGDATYPLNWPDPPSEAMNALAYQARTGDRRMSALFSEAGDALGAAVATSISLIRPDTLVITGGTMNAFDLMKDNFEARLGQSLLPWLRRQTTILVQPHGENLVEEGMVLRTLARLDRNIANGDARSSKTAPGGADEMSKGETQDDRKISKSA